MKFNKIKLGFLVVSILLFGLNIPILGQTETKILETNKNLSRLYFLINSLNQEAAKQKKLGFEKRSKSLETYFEKKTGISENSKELINRLAFDFLSELEKTEKDIAELKKNSSSEAQDQLESLLEIRLKLYEASRKSLIEGVGSEAITKIARFLQENIINKLNNGEKVRHSLHLKEKFKSNVFKKTSFGETFGNGFINGYSTIYYDEASNEVWGESVTEGTCLVDGGDHDDRENECRGSEVYSILSDPDGTGISTDYQTGQDNYASAFVFASAELDGQYCIDAEHHVEDTDYSVLYAQSYDCMNIEPSIIKRIQYLVPNTTNYEDASGYLYVLKGTNVEFQGTKDNGTQIVGTWSGTSGISGTTGTANVTFNTVSSSETDYKTVTFSNSFSQKTINVIVYELSGTMIPVDNFSGRSQSDYGIGEKVNLNFSTNPVLTSTTIGGLEWKIISGSGVIANDANLVGTGVYTAPDAAGSEVIKIEISSGPSKGSGQTFNKTIVAPSSAVSVQDTTYGTYWYTLANCGVGFYLNPRMRPLNVSFNQLLFYEGEVLPTTATGYFLPQQNEKHETGQQYTVGNGNLTTGSIINFIDGVGFDGPAPCSSGEFIWDIPWKIVTPATGLSQIFHTARHRNYIPSYNVMQVSKDGVGPFKRAVGSNTVY